MSRFDNNNKKNAPVEEDDDKFDAIAIYWAAMAQLYSVYWASPYGNLCSIN